MTKCAALFLIAISLLPACSKDKIKNNSKNMDKSNLYKVVLVFNLTEGSADEELKRSKEAGSFPNLLAAQKGFIEMELVKISDEKTMSIQTWETEKDWWAALEAAKNTRTESEHESTRENILVSREFLNGYIKIHKP